MTHRISDSAVVIAGSACIEDAVNIRERLLAALQSFNPLVIDLAQIGDADISFIQLIESARRSAGAKGISLSLAQPANDALGHDLKRGGFLHRPEDRSFWLHTTELAQ